MNSATTKFGAELALIAKLPALQAVSGMTETQALEHGLEIAKHDDSGRAAKRKETARQKKLQKEAARDLALKEMGRMEYSSSATEDSDHGDEAYDDAGIEGNSD